MYVNFIQNTLLPKLESLSEKNSIWWSFKPESRLKYYLKDHKITLNQYFQPEELKEKVLVTLTNELQFTTAASVNAKVCLRLPKLFNSFFSKCQHISKLANFFYSSFREL